MKKKSVFSQALVAHAYNLSYLRLKSGKSRFEASLGK
jgi:hypothetical protein